MRLDSDFKRDINKNLDINYYPNNNINYITILNWRMASQPFFSNWINYYIYQESPYIIDYIGERDIEI